LSVCAIASSGIASSGDWTGYTADYSRRRHSPNKVADGEHIDPS
jgi:hypothetical protein